MSIRRGLRGVVVAIVASCHGGPPPGDQPPERAEPVERVAVPGAGSAAPLPAAAPRKPNPPLQPEEAALAIEDPPPAAPGVATTARVRLTARRGYEINDLFHYKLTLEPTPGVTLPKAVFSKAGHDAERLDDHELAIAMTLTADRAGDYTVRGRFDFAVCKIGSQCLPRSMPIELVVHATL